MQLLLCAAIAASLIAFSDAHGMMCGPRQRGAYVSSKCPTDLDVPDDPVIDYCGHCLNGGTVDTVKENLPPGGWDIFEPTKDFAGTADRAGLCGDPKGRNYHMIGGDFMPYKTVPIVANWKTNSEVDFQAELDTNHNGYFEFNICNLDTCGKPDIHPSCFTGGHCAKLLRVPHKDCENPDVNTDYECGPIDDKYPGRWYVPCRNTGHVGVHIVGGSTGTMRYKLPKGFKCKHCVVQWYWATANSCAPRGFLEYMKDHNNPFGTTCESDGGGRGAHRPGMAPCGGSSLPEEFWSCADVSITNNGKSAGPVKAVGSPVDDPGTGSNDEEEAKENPDKVIEKVQEEVEKDVEMTANEETGERKERERQDAEGDVVSEDQPCDGTLPCAHTSMFCVYTESTGGFSCRYWWSLWKDAEARSASGGGDGSRR